MSAGGPPEDRDRRPDDAADRRPDDERGPADDPLAFAPDEQDAAPGAGGPRADDPFAFAPDEQDAVAPTGDDAPPTGDAPRPSGAAPAGRPSTDGPPTGDPSVGPAPAGPAPSRARRRDPEAEERTAELRTQAEQASRHAQAVGVRWLLGALVVFAIVIAITTIGGDRGEAGGDVQPGERLPAFAAPLATAPSLGDNDDVNVATRDGQGEAGRNAACSIRNPSVVTSCALLERGPLVVVLYSGGVEDCVAAVDELDRLRPRYPGLGTLAVAILGERDAVGATVRGRRWDVPTVYDGDGVLSTLLGAPACPLVLFVRKDGTVAQRIIGRLPAGALERGMRRLASGAAAPAGR